MAIVGAVVGILLVAVFSGLVIWIVGKLGLGMEVKNFGSAFVAAIVIAILNAVVSWLLGTLGVTLVGFLGAIVNLVIAAIVLMIAGKFVKGYTVKGFSGALIGAVAIAAVAWLVSVLVAPLM